MKTGDEVEFWGNKYTAVPYTEAPVDFVPLDDDDNDLQCRICALEPNYCGKKVPKDDCHGIGAFVFVKSEYVKAFVYEKREI